MRKRKTIPTLQNAEPLITLGWTWTAMFWLRSHRKKKRTQSNPPCYQMKMKTVVGVRPIQELRQSDLSSISLKR